MGARPSHRHLTRTEICRLLGVSPKTLYLWERAGKIPAPVRDRRGWRRYGSRQVEAIRRVLGTTIPPSPRSSPSAERGERGTLAGLSARNQLRGRVVGMREEGLLCEVVLRMGDGQEITAVVTRRSADRLGLRRGREAVAVIKSTEVMLYREESS